MSKDLLKEAIADAKAVRETAIANAKIALEEAFTPKLQSMLSTKISEDMYEEEEEEEEFGMDAVDEMGHEEEEVEAEPSFGDDLEGVEDADEEDLELEAIIRELEGDDEFADEDEEDLAVESFDEPVEDEDENIDLDEIIKSLEEVDQDEEDEEVNDDLEEAYATIKQLQGTLQEVNLLNAKLLFSNKLFKSNNLSEAQKVKVIETFDRAANLREVKLVYTTLTESFSSRVPRTKLAEGLASRSVNSTKPSKVIVESDKLANRMKQLAGLL
jgi:hypothetical protein|tara:strand:+ start:477 stop:1289 length:813 start_codon:yes stop_codon:yes gene_type:complete